jgi:hypothetical protein
MTTLKVLYLWRSIYNMKTFYTEKAIKIQAIQNGGITLVMGKNGLIIPIHKNGFYVSINGRELKAKQLKTSFMRLYIKNNMDLLKQGYLFGLWFNSVDRFWYFDISNHINNKNVAIYRGIINAQKSIYDIFNNESIDIQNNNIVDFLRFADYE